MTPPRDRVSMDDLPFDAEDERIIDATLRWMGSLGRFQILGGGLALLACLGTGAAWGFSVASGPGTELETAPPLVRLGEVSDLQMGIALGTAVTFAVFILRGGMLLNDAAADLEHHLHGSERTASLVEDAMGALARALWIDTAIVLAVLGLLVFLGTLT